MRIIAHPRQFKHGRMTFEQGGKYEVPEAFGGYFVGCGWAIPAHADEPGPYENVTAEQLDPNAPEVTLDVHDSTLGQSAPKIGGQ